MTYYDHETNMALKLGIWSESQPSRKVERRSWVLEKEYAESVAEKPLSFCGIQRKKLISFLRSLVCHKSIS